MPLPLLVRRASHGVRALEVLDVPGDSAGSLPLLGRIAAGRLIEATLKRFKHCGDGMIKLISANAGLTPWSIRPNASLSRGGGRPAAQLSLTCVRRPADTGTGV